MLNGDYLQNKGYRLLSPKVEILTFWEF